MLASRDSWPFYLPADNPNRNPFPIESISRKPYDRLERAGHVAPKFHAAARPQIAEREATHRAIALAELVDTPILIVHVSGQEAIEQIRWAKGRGLPTYAETCPQYLFLTADDLAAPGFHGAKCVCSPLPRDRASQA